jgi:predicted O-methyltransferase YrrM
MKFPQLLYGRGILYIKYLIRAGHRNGRGIHPPFAYDFVREVIFGEEIDGLEAIENLRNSLSGKKERIRVADYGAGTRAVLWEKIRPQKGAQPRNGTGTSRNDWRTIRKITRQTAVDLKKGRLLARISRSLDFPVILELGTGMGISALYLGMSCPGSTVLTCEGCPAIAAWARENIKLLGAKNIRVSEGLFSDWLSTVVNHIDGDLFVFVDGDHRGARLAGYCDVILSVKGGRKVIMLDDIHWSTDMYRTWNELTGRQEITLGIELFNTGILFSGFGTQRDRFVVRF